jgi:hypothetical protein
MQVMGRNAGVCFVEGARGAAARVWELALTHSADGAAWDLLAGLDQLVWISPCHTSTHRGHSC